MTQHELNVCILAVPFFALTVAPMMCLLKLASMVERKWK